MLFSANGTQLRIVGTAEVLLNISELKIPHTLYVCENLSEPLLLGRSFLTDSSAVIDFRHQTITLSDVLQLPLHCKINKDNFARANQSFCIQPKTEIILPVKCAKKFNDNDVLLTPIGGLQFHRFAVANTIGHVSDHMTVCRLLNYSDEPLVICPGQKLAQVSVFDNSYRCMLVKDNQHSEDSGESDEVPVDEETLDRFDKEYQFNINNELPRDLRVKLLRVLYRRRDAFARTLADLKSYNKEEFDIQLSSSKPLWQKQYQHKPEHARILQAHIDEWEKCGIVEPSTNYHFRNPIFLVAKGSLKEVKDPKEALNPKHYRAVLDMRKLNSRCSGLKTFTPSTRQLIEEVTKFSDEAPYERPKWYSSFDFLSGFHQLSVKPSSRPIFSFSSMRGDHLQFTKIPFGFKDSPHYFSMVMNRVLGPLKDKAFLAYYVDDCLIYGVSAEKHVQNIDLFLSVLIQNGLKCSVSKSFLMQNKIRYLGVDLGPDGISVPKEISRTLDKMETMKMNSPRAVQRFLGFINFWRAHIPQVSMRSHNLRQAITQGTPFKFTEQCQQERLDLINALRTAQALQPLAENVDIYIFVDSSSHGIGATIAQPDLSSGKLRSVQAELANIRKGSTKLRPVAHMSWTLKPSEKFYSSTSLEMAGLYKTLMAISHWATARKIHVVSDNIGLVSFNQLKLGNARERRMLAFLQSFDIYLYYLKGSSHTSGDYLSRLSSELTPAEKVEWQSAESDDYLDSLLFNVTLSSNENNSETTNDVNRRDWRLYVLGSEQNLPAQNTGSDVSDSTPATAMFVNTDSVLLTRGLSDLAPHPTFLQQQSSDFMDRQYRLDDTVPTTSPSDDTANNDKQHTRLSSTISLLPTGNDMNLNVQAASTNLNVHAAPFYPTGGSGSEATTCVLHSEQVHNENYSAPKSTVAAVRKSCRMATNQNQAQPQGHRVTEQANQADSSPAVSIPRISSQDYLEDAEYANIWNYLAFQQLTGDRKQDYHTTIVAPLYFIEDDKLYRVTFSRTNKRSADGSSRSLVVIPKKFQQAVLVDLHERYGHPAAQKLYDTARILFYFNNLHMACCEVAKTCQTCQQVKIDRNRQVPELKNLPIFGPAQIWAIDFKTLSRKTAQGHTAILVICDTFSNYCMYEPMMTQSALETAQALIRRLFASEPQTRGLVSDKGPGFMSSVFKTITQKVLGWSHWSSSSLQPQSHGMVEAAVAQLNKLINLYVPADSLIADHLPLLELAQRVTVSKATGYSPFEALRGFQPDLHLVGEVLDKNNPVPSQPTYISWLKDRLKTIHQDVHRNLLHSRGLQKVSFDKRNHVSTPTWQVGDIVWLERTQPKAGSDQILTHRKYGSEPWYITKVVQRNDSTLDGDNSDGYSDPLKSPIGTAYQLCNSKTGKTLKYLVPSRRLKRCHDRQELNKQFPPFTGSYEKNAGTGITSNAQVPSTDQRTNKELDTVIPEGWEKAKNIIRKRTRQNNTEFLVRFADNSAHWCTENDTSEELKRKFFLKQAQIRSRRQRAARNRFRD